MRHPVYKRTQGVWLAWALLPPGLASATIGLLNKEGATVEVGLAGLAIIGAALWLMFSRFTVEVGQGRVEWRYGRLGWPHWGVDIAEIAGVEPTRTTWLDGWGARRTKGGMLYNAAGFGAVALHLRDGRTLILGSDEPARLAGFIQARLPARR